MKHKKSNFAFKRSVVLLLSAVVLSEIFFNTDLVLAKSVGVIQNGDFEEGLTGYRTTDKITAEIVNGKGCDGSKCAVLGVVDGAYNNAMIYQEVAVKPNTDYVWSFYYLAASQSGKNTLIGVRTEEGNMLLPSEICSETGTLAAVSVSHNELRSVSQPQNWHQGMDAYDTKYHEYKVSFNTGNQTKVLLTLNLFADKRNGRTDNWRLFQKGEVIGDIDGDGNVDAKDLTLMRRKLLEADEIYDYCRDVNCDGTFNILDLVSLKKKIAGTNERIFNFSDLSGRFKTQGRTNEQTNGILLDWSASGLEFTADCSGTVTIEITPNYSTKNGSTGGMYFTVIVDEKIQYADKRMPANTDANSWTSNSTDYPFYLSGRESKSFVIASALSKGKHKFEIYKQTEAEENSFFIKSVKLNGTIEKAPLNKDFYIEFVGDSIIAGLGNLSKGGSNAPLYQDATRGFAYLTAKNLSADWSVIARSGITATKGIGWSGADSTSMQDVYPFTEYYSDRLQEYGFERRPDVIVVSLGTNDLWTYKKCGAKIEDVEKGFEKMLLMLRQKNPDSKIIWLYGMMTDAANSLIQKTVKNSGGSASGLYALELPENTYGGQGHPELSAQTVYAEMLTEFINSICLGKK